MRALPGTPNSQRAIAYRQRAMSALRAFGCRGRGDSRRLPGRRSGAALLHLRVATSDEKTKLGLPKYNWASSALGGTQAAGLGVQSALELLLTASDRPKRATHGLIDDRASGDCWKCGAAGARARRAKPAAKPWLRRCSTNQS